eukprot:4255229-Prymnesium_polylepis.1
MESTSSLPAAGRPTRSKKRRVVSPSRLRSNAPSPVPSSKTLARIPSRTVGLAAGSSTKRRSGWFRPLYEWLTNRPSARTTLTEVRCVAAPSGSVSWCVQSIPPR